MTLSPEERAANRAAFRAMSVPQKAEYIFAYYKLPLVLTLIVLVAVGTVVQRMITHKDAELYVAFVNVVPDEDADEALTKGFIEQQGQNPRKNEVVCYRELYLSSNASQQDHQYSYASRLKVLAAIDAEQLDVVLMNQEAYDLLSASGYLLDLQETCVGDLALSSEAKQRLKTNTVVLSDNRVEVELGEASEYEADTVGSVNALSLDGLPLLANLPESESFYLGIIANTPRLKTAVAYLEYVLDN